MVYPEVEYPPEPIAPTPPKNLAEILLALEHQDSEISAPTNPKDVHVFEFDVENHPTEETPVKENFGDVLMVKAAANPPVIDNSFYASSAGPFASVLLNTMKALQQ